MRRPIPLRQIEIFKALIENGTVSRAADVLYVSQPAASKLLKQIEEDNGLKLFDRHKGRLTPTSQGLRLYDEISRIFAGVHQVESAIESIRREDQSQLVIGIIPAFAGTVIQRATMGFLKRNPNVYCSFVSLGAQWISDRVLARTLDVGITSSKIDHPYLVTRSLLEHPLLCIMPVGHPLAKVKVVRPEHLKGVPFVSFKADSHTGQKVVNLFQKHNISPDIVLTADASLTVCEFVAAGLGISLVHPLYIAGMEERLMVRPFEPATPLDFQVCFARDARSAKLILDFVEETNAMAKRLSESLARSWS